MFYNLNIVQEYKYYFKRGNDRKAIQILNKGLELIPNNFELERRLKIIKGY